MPNRLQKLPVAVYIPAVAAEPGRPAYCEIRKVYAGYTGGGGIVSWPPAGSGVPSYPNTDSISYSAAPVITAPRRPVYTTIQRCYPAVPGVTGSPARVDYYSNAGWNSGARSIQAVPRPGYFSGAVRSSAAVMVGLADKGFNHSYASMQYAIVSRPGGFTVVERGTDKFSGPAISPGTVLELRRLEAGNVEYIVDGEVVYTSSLFNLGTLYGAALLYSLADEVDSPEIGLLSSPGVLTFDQQAPSLQALISDSDIAFLDARLPALQLEATLSPAVGRLRFSAQLPGMVALISDTPLMQVRTELPAIRLEATLSRPEALVNSLAALLPPLSLKAFLRSGQTLSFSAKLPAMKALISDAPIMVMDAVAPVRLRLLSGEPYLLPGFIDADDVVLAGDHGSLLQAILLVGLDSLEVAGTASITVVLELSGIDSMAIGDSTSFGQLVEMLAIEQVAINSNGAAARQQALQYAINAVTGAPTKYSGFNFLSFVNVDGQAYGLMPDGLYRIGGDAQSGELINALIDFGTSDFGASQAKRIYTALLGVRTDGECYLKMAADDGQEQVYRLEGMANARRAKLAKGVDGRYWSTKLELTDLSFAKVDSIELEVAVSQRHILGHRK